MTSRKQKVAWALVSAGAAAAGSELVERALNRGWRALRDEAPPTRRTARRGTAWAPALGWAAATGAAAAVAGLVARRGAALGWHSLTGRRPPRG